MTEQDESLLSAAKSGNVQAVEQALKAGGSAAFQNAQGETALMLAAGCGSVECLRRLLPLSCLNETCKGGWNALMRAADKGSIEGVQLLISDTAAKAEDTEGLTALMWAAYNGYEDCVKELLPVSDSHRKSLNGRTAYDWALAYGNNKTGQLIQAFEAAQLERQSLLKELRALSGCNIKKHHSTL